jgi:hypothetical protein
MLQETTVLLLVFRPLLNPGCPWTESVGVAISLYLIPSHGAYPPSPLPQGQGQYPATPTQGHRGTEKIPQGDYCTYMQGTTIQCSYNPKGTA